VTERVAAAIAGSGLSSGIGCVFLPGATGAVTTTMDELAPAGRDYQHEMRWHDGNGHSHLRAALLGPSLAFPFAGGEPMLGTWQQIVVIDLDNRARRRKVVL
jgi:secondary thiamine-phosphate synthase enzyme